MFTDLRKHLRAPFHPVSIYVRAHARYSAASCDARGRVGLPAQTECKRSRPVARVVRRRALSHFTPMNFHFSGCVIEHLPRPAQRSMLCARLEPGSGSGIGNKAIIISAKQQSHTEEYDVVHGSSNHTRKNTKEYDVLHVERIISN